jgi:hypothetical protein
MLYHTKSRIASHVVGIGQCRQKWLSAQPQMRKSLFSGMQTTQTAPPGRRGERRAGYLGWRQALSHKPLYSPDLSPDPEPLLLIK